MCYGLGNSAVVQTAFARTISQGYGWLSSHRRDMSRFPCYHSKPCAPCTFEPAKLDFPEGVRNPSVLARYVVFFSTDRWFASSHIVTVHSIHWRSLLCRLANVTFGPYCRSCSMLLGARVPIPRSGIPDRIARFKSDRSRHTMLCHDQIGVRRSVHA